MPVLSIITINYNNKAGLDKTILSVIDQTDKSFEFLVIDGGSDDGSKELIKKYSKEIAYSVSEKDHGIYNAQNKGVLKATGDYCLFLNSGDCLESNDTLKKGKEVDESDEKNDKTVDLTRSLNNKDTSFSISILDIVIDKVKIKNKGKFICFINY